MRPRPGLLLVEAGRQATRVAGPDRPCTAIAATFEGFAEFDAGLTCTVEPASDQSVVRFDQGPRRVAQLTVSHA